MHGSAGAWSVLRVAFKTGDHLAVLGAWEHWRVERPSSSAWNGRPSRFYSAGGRPAHSTLRIMLGIDDPPVAFCGASCEFCLESMALTLLLFLALLVYASGLGVCARCRCPGVCHRCRCCGGRCRRPGAGASTRPKQREGRRFQTEFAEAPWASAPHLRCANTPQQQHRASTSQHLHHMYI